MNSEERKILDPYIKKYKDGYKCFICDVILNCLQQAEAHAAGKKHNKHGFKKFLKRPSVNILETPEKHTRLLANQDIATSNIKDSLVFDETKTSQIIITKKMSEKESDPYVKVTEYGYKCILCSVPLNGTEQVKAHTQGKKHMDKKNKQSSVKNINSILESCNKSAPSENKYNLPNLKEFIVVDVKSFLKEFDVDEPINF